MLWFQIPAHLSTILNNVITNPIAFKDIIRELGNVSSIERVENIKNILNIFKLWLHNNIMINNPLTYDKYPIDLVKLILGAYFSEYSKEDPPTRKSLLKLMKAVTIGGRFSKSHFELVYWYITSKDPDDLLGALELIENMIFIDKSNIPMFYFSDHESFIEISSSLTISKAFKYGFTWGFWMRLEELNGNSMTQEPPALFSIFWSGSGGFEAFFEGNTLYYRTLHGKNYYPPGEDRVEVFEFEAKTWYCLFISHRKKSLKVMINGEIVQEIKTHDYPK